MNKDVSFTATEPHSPKPVVFEYLSYRAYLRDALEFRKRRSPGFSVTAFCLRTRVISKTQLSMILNERRRLPLKRVSLLTDALGLSPRERRYFEALVQFNHARTDVEKHHYLRELLEARPPKHQANLPELGYGVLYSWHCLAVLELAKLPSFQPTGKWISERLRGRLNVLEARRALDTLSEAKLLEKGTDGRVRATQATIRTSDELRSLAIQQYHHACLALGAEVLRTAPVESREFGSVNLLLTKEGLRLAKEKLKALREEILALSDAQSPGTQVCQVNFQLLNLEK